MGDEDNMCSQKHPERRTARVRHGEREKQGHELERTRGAVALYQKAPATNNNNNSNNYYSYSNLKNDNTNGNDSNNSFSINYYNGNIYKI